MSRSYHMKVQGDLVSRLKYAWGHKYPTVIGVGLCITQSVTFKGPYNLLTKSLNLEVFIMRSPVQGPGADAGTKHSAERGCAESLDPNCVSVNITAWKNKKPSGQSGLSQAFWDIQDFAQV